MGGKLLVPPDAVTFAPILAIANQPDHRVIASEVFYQFRGAVVGAVIDNKDLGRQAFLFDVINNSSQRRAQSGLFIKSRNDEAQRAHNLVSLHSIPPAPCGERRVHILVGSSQNLLLRFPLLLNVLLNASAREKE